MKVQVAITNSNKAFTTSSSINATVSPADTVLTVQEFIGSMTNTFSFPDQKLLFKGKELQSGQRLSDCGITEGDALEFQFHASEEILVTQLSDLLGKQAVSTEELGLLYSYRFAATFDDALKAMGHPAVPLRKFLESQKCFSFHGACVKLAQASDKVLQPVASLCPIEEDKVHEVIEVTVSIEVHRPGKSPELLSGDEDEDVHIRLDSAMTVAKAKDVIAASEQMPFPEKELWLGDQKLADEFSLGEVGVKNGFLLMMVVHASTTALASQLEELLWERTALSISELGLHYCQRFGTPVGQALRTLGLHANLGRFLEGHNQFSITGGCVTLVNGRKLITPASEQEEAQTVSGPLAATTPIFQ